MKLLYCPKCYDIVRIFNKKGTRYCSCGNSFGFSKDEINIVIGGNGIPIGIADNTLQGALRNRPMRGKGCNFISFIIPRNCKTVSYDKDELKNDIAAQSIRKRMAVIEGN